VKTATDKKRAGNVSVASDDSRRLKEQWAFIQTSIAQVQPHVVGVETYHVFEPREYKVLRDVAARFLSFLVPGKAIDPIKTANDFKEAFTSEAAFSGLLHHLVELQEAVNKFKYKRGQGAASKTYGIYTAVQTVCFAANIPVFAYTPTQLKTRITGGSKASKEDVERAVCAQIVGMRENVDERVASKSYPRGERDHVFDAGGHALLALREYAQWMRTGFNAQPVQTALL